MGRHRWRRDARPRRPLAADGGWRQWRRGPCGWSVGCGLTAARCGARSTGPRVWSSARGPPIPSRSPGTRRRRCCWPPPAPAAAPATSLRRGPGGPRRAGRGGSTVRVDAAGRLAGPPLQAQQVTGQASLAGDLRHPTHGRQARAGSMSCRWRASPCPAGPAARHWRRPASSRPPSCASRQRRNNAPLFVCPPAAAAAGTVTQARSSPNTVSCWPCA
jgi:hypothetical protein